MNTYTIGQLKNNGIPSKEFISGMFYDWFCKDSSLGKRGETCLVRLRSLVKSVPSKFNDSDTIDFKNCCPCCGGTYDCVRVWTKDGDFKYAFVPQENDGGCSYLVGDGGEIINCENWNGLKKSFANC